MSQTTSESPGTSSGSERSLSEWSSKLHKGMLQHCITVSNATMSGGGNVFPSISQIRPYCVVSEVGVAVAASDRVRQIQDAYTLLHSILLIRNYEYSHGCFGAFFSLSKREMTERPERFVQAVDFLLGQLQKKVSSETRAGLIRAIGETASPSVKADVARLLIKLFGNDDPLIVDAALLALSPDDLNDPSAWKLIEDASSSIRWTELQTSAMELAADLSRQR